MCGRLISYVIISFNFGCFDRTAVAIRGKDGVVFAVEKIVRSKLYERTANKRIFSVDKHVGMAVAGLMADSRQLVEISRDEAANFRSEFGIRQC